MESAEISSALPLRSPAGRRIPELKVPHIGVRMKKIPTRIPRPAPSSISALAAMLPVTLGSSLPARGSIPGSAVGRTANTSIRVRQSLMACSRQIHAKSLQPWFGLFYVIVDVADYRQRSRWRERDLSSSMFNVQLYYRHVLAASSRWINDRLTRLFTTKAARSPARTPARACVAVHNPHEFAQPAIRIKPI